MLSFVQFRPPFFTLFNIGTLRAVTQVFCSKKSFFEKIISKGGWNWKKLSIGGGFNNPSPTENPYPIHFRNSWIQFLCQHPVYMYLQDRSWIRGY